jgi:NAD-dependent SIR2 family protein deacetylase
MELIIRFLKESSYCVVLTGAGFRLSQGFGISGARMGYIMMNVKKIMIRT